jgi:hypothetical protein
LEGTNLKLSHPTTKLALRCYEPFKITKVVSPVVYHLELPALWKIFNTFHVLLLLPYQETVEHGINFPEPPPDLINGNEEYEVEQILGKRTHWRWKKKQYLIKWKGYSSVHNSWEPAENVNALDLVKAHLHESHVHANSALSNPPVSTLSTAMPLGSPHSRLSSSEIHSLITPFHSIDGIQEALNGTSPSRQPWHDDSLPYTSKAVRQDAIDVDTEHHC